MNILKLVFFLLALVEADLIGFNRLGNNVLLYEKNGKDALYGRNINRHPRYRFRYNKISMMKRYFKAI